MERKAEILAKQEEKQFTARNDFAFRWLFGTEENKEITRRFLSLVTKVEDIEEIEFETPFLLQDYVEEKTGIVDIKLTLKSGEKVNVEMQNYWSPYFPKRSLYYWAKLYAEDFVQGNDYKALSPCIVINLLNDRFPLSDKCHSVYRIMEEQEHRVLDNALEMHFLNLSKVREEDDLGELKNWLVFIQTNDRKERAKMAEGNMTLEKANEVMERFYSDKEARKKYEAALKQEADWRLFEMEFERRGMERGLEQGIEQGIQQGLEQGIEQGIQQGLEQGIEQGIQQGLEQGIEQGIQMNNLNIAKNMYDLGYSKEEIEKITGVVL